MSRFFHWLLVDMKFAQKQREPMNGHPCGVTVLGSLKCYGCKCNASMQKVDYLNR